MKKAILSGVLAALCATMAPSAYAAETETPIIEFHTNIFETYGPTNAFHIVLGAKEDTYVDIDCGTEIVVNCLFSRNNYFRQLN